MGFLPVGTSALAAIIFYARSDIKLMCLAIAAAILSFWTYGIMHNFAVEAAKNRLSFRGGFGDFRPEEVQSVTNGLALANLIASLVGFCVLVIAVVRGL